MQAPNASSEDNRKFHRILYRSPAILTTELVRYECKVIDISIKGCLLIFEPAIEIDGNETYQLKLDLSDDIAIKMELSVVHVEANKVGFECKHIDLDSISALRRLVELNLGDSALLERELNALSHFADLE